MDVNVNMNMRDYPRRVWRYQRGNQNPYIEKEQTTQWLIENRQKKQQRSTKHTHKTKHYTTLHLGTNLSKGTALLLLFYIPQ